MLLKFFLIDFTRVDTDKLKFEPARPWRAAVQRVNRKFQARHTFLTQQAKDAVDLGRSSPPLTSESHALPLVAIASSENFEVLFTPLPPPPEWARVVNKVMLMTD